MDASVFVELDSPNEASSQEGMVNDTDIPMLQVNIIHVCVCIYITILFVVFYIYCIFYIVII